MYILKKQDGIFFGSKYPQYNPRFLKIPYYNPEIMGFVHHENSCRKYSKVFAKSAGILTNKLLFIGSAIRAKRGLAYPRTPVSIVRTDEHEKDEQNVRILKDLIPYNLESRGNCLVMMREIVSEPYKCSRQQL